MVKLAWLVVAVTLAVAMSTHTVLAASQRSLIVNVTIDDFRNTIGYGYASFGFAITAGGESVCAVDGEYGTTPQGILWSIFDDLTFQSVSSPTVADGMNTVPYWTGEGAIDSVQPYTTQYYLIVAHDQSYSYVYTCQPSFEESSLSSAVVMAFFCNSRRGTMEAPPNPVGLTEFRFTPVCDEENPSNSIAIENLFFVQGSDAMTFAPSILLAVFSLLSVLAF
jgi:hypothetical protein